MSTLRTSRLVDLERGRIDAAQRQLPARDPRLELGEDRLGVDAGQRPRLRDGGRAQQLAEQLRRDERAVDREDDGASWPPRGGRLSLRTTGARSSTPSSRTANGSSSASRLADGDDLRRTSRRARARRARRASRPRNGRAPSESRSARDAPPTSRTPVAASDPPRLRVDADAPVADPAAERDAAIRRQLDRERRGRADGDEDRTPGDRRLLHELEREPPADAQDVRREREQSVRNAQPTTLSIALWRPTSSRTHRSSPVGVEEPGRVQATGRCEHALRGAQPLGQRATTSRGDRQRALDARRTDLDGLDRALPADAARGRRVEVPPQPLRVEAAGSTSTVFAARSSGTRAEAVRAPRSRRTRARAPRRARACAS